MSTFALTPSRAFVVARWAARSAPAAPYLVGERGPELFTPGADGAISTAAATRILRRGDGSFIPEPETVSRNRPAGAVSNVRGDMHFSNQWHIHEANNPHEVKRQVETTFGELLRQMESDQRGLLSD